MSILAQYTVTCGNGDSSYTPPGRFNGYGTAAANIAINAITGSGVAFGSIVTNSDAAAFGTPAAMWVDDDATPNGGLMFMWPAIADSVWDHIEVESDVGTIYVTSANIAYATSLGGFQGWYNNGVKVISGGVAWTVGSSYTVTFYTAPGPIPGQGDITNPGAWEDANNNIPPLAFQNVPLTVNFPLNGDGRYWFTPYSFAPNPPIQTFIGDPTFLTDTIALQSSIVQAATDGSFLFIAYSLDNGVTYIQQQLGPSLQSAPGSQNGPAGKSLLSNQLVITLIGGAGLIIKVFTTGGTPNVNAKTWQVAIAITRNVNERIAWDYPNPFNPISYNCECTDDVVPTETLLQLRTDILVELGFASQVANPPPGMAALVNSWLNRGQKYLYRRYAQLHTRRMFRWKVNPGQRFYSLKDNDEDVLCNFQMDPMKQIEWAGIQDSRNVWYPLVEGIEPQLYTMIDKPWRPARYEIRQCIELYPAPDQTYWLWMKAHFGLMALVGDTDKTTIDATLLFLHTLSIAKAHYGKPDANNIQAMANAYRKELIAGTHGTKRYVPGSVTVPPAVRPTLIHFQGNAGS